MNSENFQNSSSSQKDGHSRWNTEIMVVAGLVAGLVAGRSRIGKLALLATAGGFFWRYLHQPKPKASPPPSAPPRTSSEPEPISVVEAHVSELVTSFWDQGESQAAPAPSELPEQVAESTPLAEASSPFGLIEPTVETPEKKAGDDSKWAPMLAEALLLDHPVELVEAPPAAVPLFQSNFTIADMLAGSAPIGVAEVAQDVMDPALSEGKQVNAEPVVSAEASGIAPVETEVAAEHPTGESEAVSDPVWVDAEPEPVHQAVAEPVAEAPAQSSFHPSPGPETQLMSSAAWLLGLEPMPMISAAGSVAVVSGRSEAGEAVPMSASTAKNLGAEIPDRIEIPEHLAQVPADVPPVPQIEPFSMRPITKGFLTKVLETVDARPKTVPLTPAVDAPKPKLAIPLASADVPMTSPLATPALESNPVGAGKSIPRPASWLAAELAMKVTPPPSPEPEAEKASSRRIQPLAPATAGEKKAWLEWWK